MSKYLCIRVTFANGSYHGEEWPPSPMRLFQAMVAGAGSASGNSHNLPGEYLAAFHWLENLEPPVIRAQVLNAPSGNTYYVPNNSDDLTMEDIAKGMSPMDVEANRRKRYNMKTVLQRPASPVHYFWKIDSKDEERARDCIRISHHLFCLGRGMDHAWATGSIENRFPKDSSCWMPEESLSNGNTLRVPVNGSMATLTRRQYARSQKISARDYVDFSVKYREIVYSTEDSVSDRHREILTVS